MKQFSKAVGCVVCGAPNKPHSIALRTRMRAFAGVFVAGTLLAGCGNDEAPPAQLHKENVLAMQTVTSATTSPVTVVTAKTLSWPQHITADAELISLTSPTLSAQVSGNLDQVFVIPGQEVKAGQLLALLNTGDLSLSDLEAQAQLAQLMAQLTEKERSLARNKDLLARGFISQAALETVQADTVATQQQVRAARARAELAQRNLVKARIVAPFDAVIATLHVAPGSYVRQGDTLLDLWSAKASSVRLRIPQQYAGMVMPGQPTSLRWNGKEIQTTLRHVRPNIDAASRSFEAHAHVPTPLRLVTGVALTATIHLDDEAIVSVPAQAVQLDGSDAFVYLAVQESRAQKRMIKTGRQRDGYIEILEGIRSGDPIIVEGAAFVRDGHPIHVDGSRTPAPAIDKPTNKLTKQHAATTTAMVAP